jgi:O-acetyl-ADP-ribose deacetylase (regulator of RNase III)
MISEKVGNIFTTKCQTIVNTVNCVGVMGAGIAYEFRLRYPNMFQKYQVICEKKQLDIGKLWIYTTEEIKILNFPTKHHWKYPSKEEYLHKGLKKFVESYQEKNISSIAFPLLGADKGGLEKENVLKIMKFYLSQCDIDIEIWEFDPKSEDDLYKKFKSIFNKLDDNTIKNESKIRIDLIKKVRAVLLKDEVNSFTGLLGIKGIGDSTLEKLFKYINEYEKKNINLFSYSESCM